MVSKKVNNRGAAVKRVRAHLYVQGRVQGVFFRESTRRQAEELGLVGWVRNRQDGRVEVVAEGVREVVEQLVDFVREGPTHAKVSDVELLWTDARGEFRSFKVEASC